MLRFMLKLVLLLAICSSLAAADSIQLRNGRHLQGKYLGGSTTLIAFMTSGAVEYFPTSDVLALLFDNTEPPFNGIQPNHMNGDSAQPTQPGTTRNISGRPRKKTHQSQGKLKRADAVWPSAAD
jgi:hypothetical protein